MQGGTDSTEFRIPDSDLEGSLELRVPNQQPSRPVPVPSDKILFPRRMLYVEAVLYLAVAASAFGLGYLAGRGRSTHAGKEEASVEMQGVNGKVWLVTPKGEKRGDEGAVVIVLPANKTPEKLLPIAGLRPGDAQPTAGGQLAELGGALARADHTGEFTLSVQSAESYRILVIHPKPTGEPVAPLEKPNSSELGKYFDAPADLLLQCRCGWLTKDLRHSAGPIEVEFTE